jgi:hypothetical protein
VRAVLQQEGVLDRACFDRVLGRAAAAGAEGEGEAGVYRGVVAFVRRAMVPLREVVEAASQDSYFRKKDKRVLSLKAGKSRVPAAQRLSKYEHVPLRATAHVHGSAYVLDSRKCFVPSLAADPPQAVVSLSQTYVHRSV